MRACGFDCAELVGDALSLGWGSSERVGSDGRVCVTAQAAGAAASVRATRTHCVHEGVSVAAREGQRPVSCDALTRGSQSRALSAPRDYRCLPRNQPHAPTPACSAVAALRSFNPAEATTPFVGGESAALARLAAALARPQWLARFAKPDTSPTALEPDTTGGCGG